MERPLLQSSGFSQLRGSTWLLWFVPNLPVLLLGILGWLGETLLLGSSRDNVYQMRGVIPCLVFLSLSWFWLTLGWLFWGAIHLVRARTACGSLRAKAIIAAVSVLAMAALATYLASWGFYLRTGRFIGLQLLIRIVKDGPELWQYLLAAEVSDLMAFAVVAAVALACMVLLVIWLVRCDVRGSDSTQLRRMRRIVWCTFTILVGMVFRFVIVDPSDLRRVPRIATLKFRLNPVFTIVGTTIDGLLEEPISPNLNTSELTPIPSHGDATGEKQADQPPIVMVVIEAMRHDVIGLVHDGREVTPNLNLLAKTGLQLTRAYSQSTHTDYAEPCIVSSLYPARTRRHCYYQPSDRWPRTMIYDVLRSDGYSTALLSSENLGWGAMESIFQSPGLDFMYDAQRSGEPTYVPDQDGGFLFETRTGPLRAGKLEDSVTIDRAIRWLSHQSARGRPFFVYVDLQSSHFPYPIGPGVPRVFQPCVLSSRVTFMDYPIGETPIVRNAYYNALHEADRQLGRLMAALAERGVLDRSILVVTSDHGEAFHENDRVTHAREPYEAVARVPCIIHAPGRVPAGIDDYPFQHIDLAPTILGLIQHGSHPNFQGINALAMDRPPAEDRLLFIHAENGLARVDAVVQGGRWKLIYNRRTEQKFLFDLAEDRGELVNRVDKDPVRATLLFEILTTWRSRQLAYYHFPMYYLRFYPPAPPGFPQLPLAIISGGSMR